ncbi:hypothetical protein ABH534_11215 [Escherichia coli]|uniref:hypothetical protein n=1 Tax=Escherichia coli TaxID=562 RepID=UPI003266940B
MPHNAALLLNNYFEVFNFAASPWQAHANAIHHPQELILTCLEEAYAKHFEGCGCDVELVHKQSSSSGCSDLQPPLYTSPVAKLAPSEEVKQQELIPNKMLNQ